MVACNDSTLRVDVLALGKLKTLRAIWIGVFFTTIGGAMEKFLPSFYIRVHGLGVGEVIFIHECDDLLLIFD